MPSSRAVAGDLLSFLIGVFRVLQDIGNVDGSTLQRGPTGCRAAVGREGMSVEEFSCLRRKAASCDQVIQIISPAEHIRLVGAAEARHRLHQRVENRLEVDGRAADDLEHVGGRGLLLKRTR